MPLQLFVKEILCNGTFVYMADDFLSSFVFRVSERFALLTLFLYLYVIITHFAALYTLYYTVLANCLCYPGTAFARVFATKGGLSYGQLFLGMLPA